MVINKKQREAFHKAAKPMIKFLNDNCHPHCHVTIDCGGAELSEGVASIVDDSFIKDRNMEVDMNSDGTEEIQKATACPEWNECAHKSDRLQALIDERIEREKELQAENNKLREALEALSNCSERAFCATADEWDCAWQLTNEALKGMGEDDE